MSDNILSQFELNLVFDDIMKKESEVVYTKSFEVHIPNTKVFHHMKYYDEEVNKLNTKLTGNMYDILIERLVNEKTFDEIGKHFSITKQRVSQIEQSAIRKTLPFIPKELLFYLKEKISKDGLILAEYIPILDKTLSTLISKVITHKYFKGHFEYDQKLNAIINDKAYAFQSIENKLIKFIENLDRFVFTQNEMKGHLNALWSNINSNILLNKFIEHDVISVLKDGKLFFSNFFKSKVSKIEFIYRLYPDGIETYKEIEKMKEGLDYYFPNTFSEQDKKRNIASQVNNSDQIVLWDWGKHIHLKHIEDIINNFDFSSVLEWIENQLKQIKVIDLDGFYVENTNTLYNLGIQNKYALHTLLKIKYPNEFTYQDAPRISSIGEDRIELTDLILETMNRDKVFSLDELSHILQSPTMRVQQLIDRVNNIITVDTFQYIKKEYLNLNSELIENIISFTNTKVKELGFIYIGLIIDEFREYLHILGKYDRQVVLLDILKKTNLKKEFNVSNTRLVNKAYPLTRISLNFHYLLYQFMEDKNTISKNDLFEYFVLRGLNSKVLMHYFYYSPIKLIGRISEETFIKLDYINYDEKVLVQFNTFIESNITNVENRLEDLIEICKDKPLVDGYKWNRFLITDLIDKNIYQVTPNLDNPIYITLRTESFGEEA